MTLTWVPAPEANPGSFSPQIYTHSTIIGLDKGSRTFYLHHILAPSSPLPSRHSQLTKSVQTQLSLCWHFSDAYGLPRPPPPFPHYGCFTEGSLYSSNLPRVTSSHAAQKPIGALKGGPLPSRGGADQWLWQVGQQQQWDTESRPTFTYKIRGVF